MTVCVVTASIGQRRRSLYTPNVVSDFVEYHAFSDRLLKHREPWQLHLVKRSDDPAVWQAKRFKLFANEHLPHASAILWIDAHCRLMSDPVALLAGFSESIALVEHSRRCIYHEARACISKKKDNKQKLQAAAQLLRHEIGHPPRWGLFWGGFILRRIDERSNDLMRAWWDLMKRTTARDQITLPVALRNSGIPFHRFAGGRRPDLFRLQGR